MSECENSSWLPFVLNYSYSSIFLIAVIVVGAKEYFKFKKQRNEKISCNNFLKDVWKKKRCYLGIINHIMDQGNDISVVISYGQMAINNFKCKNHFDENDGNINFWGLFYTSIFILIIYRLFSSLWVYQITHTIYRAIGQLFDFDLIFASAVNYALDNDRPCNPQIGLEMIEITFDAAPQVINK